MTGPRVAIVGAGFGGIAAAYYLKQRGLSAFTVFERSAGIGGTWWTNRYPGAEVDTWSHLYSYSFHRGDFSRTHVRQAELQRYLEATVDKFGLREHIELNAAVDEIAWRAERNGYELRFADRDPEVFDAVISAVGMFTTPSRPTLPGLDQFRG